MRLIPVVLLVGLAGCLEGTGADFGGVLSSCPEPDQDLLVTTFDVLAPSAAADAFSTRYRISVEAQEGDTLTGTAGWTQGVGAAQLLFDGPGGIEVTTGQSWSFSGAVPAGNYSIELEGAPFAVNGIMALTLVASSC